MDNAAKTVSNTLQKKIGIAPTLKKGSDYIEMIVEMDGGRAGIRIWIGNKSEYRKRPAMRCSYYVRGVTSPDRAKIKAFNTKYPYFVCEYNAVQNGPTPPNYLSFHHAENSIKASDISRHVNNFVDKFFNRTISVDLKAITPLIK